MRPFTIVYGLRKPRPEQIKLRSCMDFYRSFINKSNRRILFFYKDESRQERARSQSADPVKYISKKNGIEWFHADMETYFLCRECVPCLSECVQSQKEIFSI
ncbi:unnamed protein product [Rotaria socialis]